MPDGKIILSTALDNKQLEKDLQSTLKKINALEKSLAEMGSGRNALAEQANQMGAQLDAAKRKLYEMQDAIQTVGKSVEKVGQKLSSMIRRVIVFSVLTSALRSFRTWIGNVIKSNSEASASLAQLKAALLTIAAAMFLENSGVPTSCSYDY